MANYREQLKELQQKYVRKGHLESLVADLEQQYEELKSKVFLYEAQMNQEQADVDKLEGRSLSAFFAGLRGNKEERLDKERQEARAARVKYDMAVLERNQVEDDLRRRKEELADLETIPAQREAILTQWAQDVKAMGGPIGQAVSELEERMVYLTDRQLKTGEAIAAGQEALMQMDSILKSLKEAEGFGQWGMMGGGFGVTMEKYDALEAAKGKAEELQSSLGRFNAAMQEVSVDGDLEFLLEDITEFGDFYFQNIFTEQVAQQRIYDAQIKAMVTRDFMQEAQDELVLMESQYRSNWEKTAQELEEILSKI